MRSARQYYRCQANERVSELAALAIETGACSRCRFSMAGDRGLASLQRCAQTPRYTNSASPPPHGGAGRRKRVRRSYYFGGDGSLETASLQLALNFC